MAKIILNVELNKGNVDSEIKQIQSQLQNISIGKTPTTKVNALQKSFANLLSTLKNAKNKYPTDTFANLEKDIQNALTSVKALNSQIGSGKATTAQKQRLVSLQKSYESLSATFATTRAETEQLDSAVLKSGDSFLASAKKFLQWQIIATVVMKPLRALTDAFNDWNETLVNTEKRIVEISRVVSEKISDATMANKLYDLAQQYGQTFDNVSEIALNFARAGVSWNDTIKATEAAVLALNVAELDATQASDGMIAIMTQFGIDASQLTDVVDMLNITADNAAVSTEKLLTALQRTGSSAKNANLELDETVSIITALSEATGRSGENLGTAVNSLIQFTQKSSALDTFAKLSDNMANIVQNYRTGQGDILDIWKGLSEEIQSRQNAESVLSGLLTSDEGKELNEQLKAELGDVFGEITEIYDTASTFRKNYFIALLNNMDKVEEAMDTLQNRASYSAEENEKYLNTYEAKLNALNAQWQKFLNSQDGLLAIKKALIDIASGLLTAFEYLGGIRTLLIAVVGSVATLAGAKILAGLKTLVATIKAATAATLTWQTALGWITIAATAISAIVGVITKAIDNQKEARKEAITTWETEQEAAQNLNATYEALQKLTPTTEEYYNTEQKLVKLLSEDKQNALKNLTAGTEEYSEAVKKLTEQENKRYEQELTAAKKAAEEQLAGMSVPGRYIGGAYGFTAFKQAGSQRGNLVAIPRKLLNKYDITLDANELSIESTAEAQYQNYLVLTKKAEQFWDAYKNATIEGNQKEADYFYTGWETLSEYINEAKEAAEKYENAVNGLWSLQQETAEEIKDNVASIKTDIGEIGDTLREKVITALKEVRDTTKDAYDYEEKKKKVLEAEQALLDAQNQRNVAIFNEKTGQFEYVRNEKSVKQAEEKLVEARRDVEEEAYNEIETELKNGNATNAKILEIIAKWAAAYGSGDFNSVAQTVADVIKNETGISLSIPTESGGGTTSISGGGGGSSKLGFLDSESGFIRSLSAVAGDTSLSRLGLLAGAIAQTLPDATTTNNTTTTNTTNHYTANGITLTREQAKNNSFVEMLETLAFVDSGF